MSQEEDYHYTIEGPDGRGRCWPRSPPSAGGAVGLAVTYDPSWSDPPGLGVYIGSVPA